VRKTTVKTLSPSSPIRGLSFSATRGFPGAPPCQKRRWFPALAPLRFPFLSPLGELSAQHRSPSLSGSESLYPSTSLSYRRDSSHSSTDERLPKTDFFFFFSSWTGLVPAHKFFPSGIEDPARTPPPPPVRGKRATSDRYVHGTCFGTGCSSSLVRLFSWSPAELPLKSIPADW